ncbi:hypothetical protein AAZX31_10G242200 [Glycine max]
MSSAKKSCGRQKIEMKKMSNESNLQTLCGADVTLVVFSPGEKVFSFAHPNVDAVIDRYLARAPPTDLSGAVQFVEAHRMAHLNLEKKEAEAHLWWARSVEGMSMAQVKQFKAALEEMKKQVSLLADRAMLQIVTNRTHQFFPAGASSANSSSNSNPLPPTIQNFMFHDGSMMRHHGFDYGRSAGFF